MGFCKDARRGTRSHSARLKIGAVDDPLEREADRAAEQVMRMPAPALALTPAPPRISRKCAACEAEEEELHRKPAGPGAGAGTAAPDNVHDVLRSSGQPLDRSARGFFEQRFGTSFADVRIHADDTAAGSAEAVDARAYAAGHHIVFGPGEYDPASQAGRLLLAHELAHVMQGSGGIRRKAKTAGDTPELKFEPAVNTPPCACVVFIHNDERKARATARLLHTNCRYNLAMVQDPDKLKSRTIQVPKHGEMDPNSMFPAEVIDACQKDDKACRDFVTDKKTSTKSDEILDFAQRQYFLAIKDCSDSFKLPVVALHNNALDDTAAYRAKMASKGVGDLKLDVDKGKKETGADVLDTIRKLIKDKFGKTGEKQTLDTAHMTNVFRLCKSDDIERCHIGNPEHPDNVVWVTNPADFDRLRKTDTNVVFEKQEAKPASSESAGDLSTMFVLLALRLADEKRRQEAIAGELMIEQLLDDISGLTSPFTDEDPDATDARDKAIAVTRAKMKDLADQSGRLRYINIETEGKGWGKDTDRIANFHAITAALDGLGLHCCDVKDKGDAGVEAGLKGDEP